MTVRQTERERWSPYSITGSKEPTVNEVLLSRATALSNSDRYTVVIVYGEVLGIKMRRSDAGGILITCEESSLYTSSPRAVPSMTLSNK